MTWRLAIGLVAATATLSAVEPPPSDPGVPSQIRMNAVVSDARGRAVGGLKADDFQLEVDGSKLQIDDVRFVDPDAGPSSTEAPTPIFSRADEEAAAAEDGSR